MNRTSLEYRNGVEAFLDFAFTNAGGCKLIVCPCNKCKVGYNHCFTRDVVAHHLMFNGFWLDYKEWVHHGELTFEPSCSLYSSKGHNSNNNHVERSFGEMDAMGMLNDLFRVNNPEIMRDGSGGHIFNQEDGGDEDYIDASNDQGNQELEGENYAVDDDAAYERLLEQLSKNCTKDQNVQNFLFYCICST